MAKTAEQGLRPGQQQQQGYRLNYTAKTIPALLSMNSSQLGDWLRREADRNPCVELSWPQAGRADLLEEMAAAPPDTDFRADLLQQLPAGADPLLLRAARVLIGQLEDTGYLPLDPLAAASGAQRALLERALALVQGLDPAGVGARSLRECYLLQARRAPERYADVLELVSSEDAFACYKAQDFASLCRAFGWTRQRLDAVTQALREMPMHPLDGEDAAGYIVPDAEIIQRPDGGFAVRILDGLLPHVEISSTYADSVRAGGTRFANEGLYYANRLLYCLGHRNATLLGLLQYAAERQAAWLGGGARVRLTVSEAARIFHLSRATASRALANKYVRFQGELMPASALFCRGGTREVSRDAACQLIDGLIREQPAGARPLSDRLLAQALYDRYGITLSRRTVTKYRAALGRGTACVRRRMQEIPPSAAGLLPEASLRGVRYDP